MLTIEQGFSASQQLEGAICFWVSICTCQQLTGILSSEDNKATLTSDSYFDTLFKISYQILTKQAEILNTLYTRALHPAFPYISWWLVVKRPQGENKTLSVTINIPQSCQDHFPYWPSVIFRTNGDAHITGLYPGSVVPLVGVDHDNVTRLGRDGQ